jgi:hypothetical protein
MAVKRMEPAGTMIGERQEQKQPEPLISDNPWPSNVPGQLGERQERSGQSHPSPMLRRQSNLCIAVTNV